MSDIIISNVTVIEDVPAWVLPGVLFIAAVAFILGGFLMLAAITVFTSGFTANHATKAHTTETR